MSFPSIVPGNSAIMQKAREGSLKSVIAMFKAGEAAYTDTAPNGTSLLHVSFPQYNDLKYALTWHRSLLGSVTPIWSLICFNAAQTLPL